MANGETGNFSGIGYIEFLFDVGVMGADGFRAQVKNFSNVVDRLALSKEPEDFKLPLTEVLQHVCHAVQFHHCNLLGNVGTEVDFPFRHLVKCFIHFFRCTSLGDKAFGTGLVSKPGLQIARLEDLDGLKVATPSASLAHTVLVKRPEVELFISRGAPRTAWLGLRWQI